MDIQEKILKIINYSVGEGGIDTSSNEMVDAILSLIRQEIAEAIPRKRDVNGYDEMANFRSGYNQALSDIQSALKKKGLI